MISTHVVRRSAERCQPKRAVCLHPGAQVFTEAEVRASVVFQLSSLLAVLQRAARAAADCDEWDAIVAGGFSCLPARAPRCVRVIICCFRKAGVPGKAALCSLNWTSCSAPRYHRSSQNSMGTLTPAFSWRATTSVASLGRFRGPAVCLPQKYDASECIDTILDVRVTCFCSADA